MFHAPRSPPRAPPLPLQIAAKNPQVIKNYGIWLRYDSRSGTHNMYKEYRDLSVTDAVAHMYQDMAARHRCRCQSLQIIKIAEVRVLVFCVVGKWRKRGRVLCLPGKWEANSGLGSD